MQVLYFITNKIGFYIFNKPLEDISTKDTNNVEIILGGLGSLKEEKITYDINVQAPTLR